MIWTPVAFHAKSEETLFIFQSYILHIHCAICINIDYIYIYKCCRISMISGHSYPTSVRLTIVLNISM